MAASGARGARSWSPHVEPDHEEEMPRVSVTRRQRGRVRPVRALRRRLPVLRAAQARRGRRDGAPHRGRRHLVDRDRRGPSSCSPSAAMWCSSERSSCAESEPDRLARELPDHDGRPGRDAPVRGRRRGRRGADRVGAAPLGHGGGLVACRMVAFMVLLYVIYAGLAAARRHRTGDGPVSRGRLVCDHDHSRDRRRVLFVVAGAMALLPATSSGAWSAGRPARVVSLTGWRARRPCPRWRPAACAPRST